MGDVGRSQSTARSVEGGGRGRRRQVPDMDSELHASIAKPFTANEVIRSSDIQMNHISSSSGGEIMEWLIGIAILILCFVHLQHIHLVPVVHKN